MARAHSDTGEEIKRAPRRRVPRKTTRTSTRARAISSETEEVLVSETAPRRKSPTVISPSEEVATGRRGVSRGLWVSVGTVVACSVLAVFIGVSDAGQINIDAVVNNQNSGATGDTTNVGGSGDGDGAAATIPVQSNTSNLPSGGLRPSTGQPTAPVAPVIATTTEEVASTTATGTEAVATSTTEVSGEESEVAAPETEAVTTEMEETGDTEATPTL